VVTWACGQKKLIRIRILLPDEARMLAWILSATKNAKKKL
jgi:hypothetical protein